MILVILLVSILWPESRVWPAPRLNSWQYVVTAVAYVALFGSGMVLGAQDWNSSGGSHWFFGLLFLLAGVGLSVWGIQTLTVPKSLGVKGALSRSGPYQYSRNPQFLGGALAMLGFALLASSQLVWIVSLLCIVCLLISPFAEEIWLEERYGQEYMAYQREVSRFFDLSPILPKKRRRF